MSKVKNIKLTKSGVPDKRQLNKIKYRNKDGSIASPTTMNQVYFQPNKGSKLQKYGITDEYKEFYKQQPATEIPTSDIEIMEEFTELKKNSALSKAEIKKLKESGEAPDWMYYADNVKAKVIKAYISNSGERMEKPYEFSPKASKKYGISNEKQIEYYRLFKAANLEVKKLRSLTDSMVGREFYYTLDVPPDKLAQRVKAAEHILSGTYLKDIAKEYYEVFLSAYKEEIPEKDYNALKKAMKSITPHQFLQFIKNSKMSAAAYTIQSKKDAFGVNSIIQDVRYMVKRINDRDMFI